MADNKDKDIGAIWIMKSRAGNEYLSMTIEIEGRKRYFVAFTNNKTKDTHPDYRIFPSDPTIKTTPKSAPKPKSAEPQTSEPSDEFPF